MITYATLIPPMLPLYVPALSDPAPFMGGCLDKGISWGAVPELKQLVSDFPALMETGCNLSALDARLKQWNHQ